MALHDNDYLYNVDDITMLKRPSSSSGFRIVNYDDGLMAYI